MSTHSTKATIVDLPVDEELWQRFMDLPEGLRTAYLRRVVNDSVKDLLTDASMLQWYLDRYGKEQKK